MSADVVAIRLAIEADTEGISPFLSRRRDKQGHSEASRTILHFRRSVVKKCICCFLLILAGCGGSGGSPAADDPLSSALLPFDTTPPVITRLGNNPQVITTGTTYIELGATAMDDVDGDISGSIVIDSTSVNTSAAGGYSVTYDVADSSSNTADTVIRTVTVQDPPPPLDTAPPVITLLGDNPQVITTGITYIELGAKAMDDVDGDISGSIIIDSTSVNTSTAGSHSATYDVTDSSGNTANTVIRTVAVQDPPLSTGPKACKKGSAGGFPCSGISLSKRVPLKRMGGTWSNDIWGWFDAQSGNEYALMGMNNGTAFVDITSPENPVILGRLATETAKSKRRDIKVYQNHAYIVADGAGAHGMQVFDLTRLRGLLEPQTFAADVVYGDFENAHNLAINEDTGFAYAVRTNTCGGGLHIIDITTPINPIFAGCHSPVTTHDTQCVIYQGPDTDHLGNEVCVSSNQKHVEIVDVTDKTTPVQISSTTYPQLGFVHQGWLTEDHRFFLVGDEGDEITFGVPTRTHVLDVSDLDAPVHVFAYEAATVTIDHNLYVLGNSVFEANYTSGLRVLEFGDLANRELMEIAFFDTFPSSDAIDELGARSVYPYLPSGTIIVSDTANGLFILSFQ